MFNYISYEKCLARMKEASWDLDIVFKSGEKLDFKNLFLPEALIGSCVLKNTLNDSQYLLINQITANSYFHFFFFLEEFIVAKTNQFSSNTTTHNAQQALHNFSMEEFKHQFLFQRLKQSVAKGLKFEPITANMQKQAARDLMEISDMAALLFILHMEIITQNHYLESIKDAKLIEPKVIRVLKNHWIEESQHSKLDFLQLQELTCKASPSELSFALKEYVTGLYKLKEVFKTQSAHDVTSFNHFYPNVLDDAQLNKLAINQFNVYVDLFIKRGMNNTHFQKAIELLFKDQKNEFYGYKESSQLHAFTE